MHLNGIFIIRKQEFYLFDIIPFFCYINTELMFLEKVFY
jgi:hypothetical protein